ncbi:MAG TPA: gamma-glutamyltransferase family protein [Gemmatimonadaceae bacterium]|nr:gamma-glutamyltransferase family protein [Gemmatimonadaceae bacterium]
MTRSPAGLARRACSRPVALVVLASAVVLASSSPLAAQSAADSARLARLPLPGRSVVATRDGIVASAQPLASMAGVAMLERGGNAVDAAIAANAAIGLLEPHNAGVGGDLFALVWIARERKLYALNASGWAPRAMTVEWLASRGVTKLPAHGAYTVTVPGTVAGWDALRIRFGTLPFRTLFAPAIHHAERGFPMHEVVANDWSTFAGQLPPHPGWQRLYLVAGERPPRAGEVFRNPELARTLRRIAAEGSAGFYTGPTARAIVDLLRAEGGVMSLEDLSDFRAEWVEPISTGYRGWTVYEAPPQGQGIAALMMLNLMQRFPLREWGFHSTRALHAMIEAKKLAYADMLRYVGDTRFASVPVARLLDGAHAAARAKLIDSARARCTVEPSVFDGLTNRAANETIYLATADREGNVVSLIQSNAGGFGAALVPAGTGFVLHNRGVLFTLERDHPNTLAPRKRPLHTIIPAMMTRGDTVIGFGIIGGWNQSQAHAQFVSNVADHDMTIQQALEAGRFVKHTFAGCDVELETRVPADVRAQLGALGHQVREFGPRTGRFGYGQAVMVVGGAAGLKFGASDPRTDGAAIPEGAPATRPPSQGRSTP